MQRSACGRFYSINPDQRGEGSYSNTQFKQFSTLKYRLSIRRMEKVMFSVIIFPLGLCPFRWGTPVTGLRSILGVPQSQVDGVLTNQDRIEYSLIRTGWGNPLPDRLCLDRLRHGRYASYGFPRDNFLVYVVCMNKYCVYWLITLMWPVTSEAALLAQTKRGQKL